MTLRLLLLVFLAGMVPSARALDPNAPQQFEREIRPVLMTYCRQCHKKDKDIPFLVATNLSDIGKDRHTWHSVVAQLQNRTMPPADEDQPTEADRIRIAKWLKLTLRETACNSGDYAGSVTARRLNRLEYDNTIRDLIGLELHFSETFPADGGGGEGFNNNGETLFLPVILLERYLEAAQEILDAAIITPPLQQKYGPKDLYPVSDKPVAPRNSLKKGEETAVALGIYVNSDYTLRVTAQATGKSAAPMAIKVDGIAAHRFNAAPGEARVEQAVVRLPRGVHTISLRCNDGSVEITQLEIKEKQATPSKEKRAAHQRIFGKTDTATVASLSAEQRREQAATILGNFTRRAFRRPVTAGELERIMTLYDRGAQRGDPFEECIKLSLKSVLVSSQFLFRIEQEHAQPGIYPLTDYELASRLSYFLWSSMPDEELMRLAGQGALKEPMVLKAEVKRMLADPKARSFVEDFTGQWLGTKEVGASVAFTGDKFKGLYTSELAADLREEPVQLMQYIIAENRSLLELLDAKYTFLTERIAKHYGIADVKGSKFRKVELTDEHRGGIVGLGAVHMLTAYPNRTSPVLRGAWVLETILGTPVPPPPPGVPPLEKTSKKSKGLTLRQQMEKHRANPTCAACHDVIDPIGFGMENYDVLGRWRDMEGKLPINASGLMPSGERFEGPAGLKQVLLNRKEDFARHLTAKMLGYALGRSLEDRDDCTIEKLVTELEQNDFKAQTLIEGVVLSTQFRNRQGGEPPHEHKSGKPSKKKQPPTAKPVG